MWIDSLWLDETEESTKNYGINQYRGEAGGLRGPDEKAVVFVRDRGDGAKSAPRKREHVLHFPQADIP